MNENIALSGLFLITLMSPILVKFLTSTVDMLDKATLKNSLGYIFSSTTKSLSKSFIFKTIITPISLFKLFSILLVSQVLSIFVWGEFLNVVTFENYNYILLLFFSKISIVLFYFSYSRRINTTDLLIQISNYFIFFLASYAIYIASVFKNSLTTMLISLFSLMILDIFLITRVEKLLAIQSIYIKYIFEYQKIIHALVYINIILKYIVIVSIDIKLILLIILPLGFTLFNNMFFSRTLNSKFQGINKRQDRMLICIMLIILSLGMSL